MSLFSSIQLAGNAINTAQTGLAVTANNISNANTPGYLRQRLVLEPAPTQKQGDVILGLGVKVTGVVQQVDAFLEDRLRASSSDLANGETEENAYLELEQIVGELSDNDLSTSLNTFFGSVNDILNQPENAAVRNLAVLQGDRLASDINRMEQRVRDVQENFDDRIIAAADDINRLFGEIAELNEKIVLVEGGRSSNSDAVGLRDQRQNAIAELAQLMDIKAVEQPTGAVTVFSQGDFVVFEGEFREVKVEIDPQQGVSRAEIRIAATDKAVTISSGEVAGLISARDEILGGFLQEFDGFASNLIYEFNKVFSSGQGLSGYTSLTSEFQVDDVNAALDQAGLPFTPENGSLQVQVLNTQTGLTETTDILIDLNGLDGDTTLASFAAQLDAIEGIDVATSPERGLDITTSSANVEFSFANDTSGVLAALGLNTFFSGTGSHDVGVKQALQDDPGKFAASRGGVGTDTEIAVELAALYTTDLESLGGLSLSQSYETLAAGVTQGASEARAVAEGFRVFHLSLESKKLSVSGVSLDEEAIDMIGYQRMFQAAARYVQTVNELLETLVNL